MMFNIAHSMMSIKTVSEKKSIGKSRKLMKEDI